FGGRSISKCIIGDKFHPAACMNRRSRLRHGIKTERMVRASGNHDILKNFPRSSEIDQHCAFGNKKGNRYAALDRRLERVCCDRRWVVFTPARSFDWTRAPKWTEDRKYNCSQ